MQDVASAPHDWQCAAQHASIVAVELTFVVTISLTAPTPKMTVVQYCDRVNFGWA
jgi:hypothetical protein